MIIAIDPGISGAAAALSKGGFVDVIDLPTVGEGKRRMIYVRSFWCWVGDLSPKRIVMENVHAMPKQGVSGVFRFGVAVGILQAICVTWMGHDVELVEPAVWKQYFQLPGKDKEAARQMAIRLFSTHADGTQNARGVLTRKKDHQRAEAMLIAWWAMRPPVGRNW